MKPEDKNAELKVSEPAPEYEALLGEVTELLESARSNAVRAVN